jgi:hypothetical protein
MGIAPESVVWIATETIRPMPLPERYPPAGATIGSAIGRSGYFVA